jgi:transcriptional regulator with XRE-family HTH domain
MNPELPSTELLAARLKLLKGIELEDLASRSGVPASTLWKIRMGVTPNPGLETVRKFFHLLPEPATEHRAA